MSGDREHTPMRGSDVAEWIKKRRDGYLLSDGSRPLLPTMQGAAYLALDGLLDDYRDHADVGIPLRDPVEGPHGSQG